MNKINKILIILLLICYFSGYSQEAQKVYKNIIYDDYTSWVGVSKRKYELKQPKVIQLMGYAWGYAMSIYAEDAAAADSCLVEFNRLASTNYTTLPYSLDTGTVSQSVLELSVETNDSIVSYSIQINEIDSTVTVLIQVVEDTLSEYMLVDDVIDSLTNLETRSQAYTDDTVAYYVLTTVFIDSLGDIRGDLSNYLSQAELNDTLAYYWTGNKTNDSTNTKITRNVGGVTLNEFAYRVSGDSLGSGPISTDGTNITISGTATFTGNITNTGYNDVLYLSMSDVNLISASDAYIGAIDSIKLVSKSIILGDDNEDTTYINGPLIHKDSVVTNVMSGVLVNTTYSYPKTEAIDSTESKIVQFSDSTQFGEVDTAGLPVANQLAIFTAANKIGGNSLYTIDYIYLDADENAGFGNSNMFSFITSGGNNNTFGNSSSYQMTSGDNNCAFGRSSLFNDTSGSGNSAYGYLSLTTNHSGDNNCAFGFRVLQANTTGDYNIGIGNYAGLGNTSESNRLYINSINRTNILGDTTLSIIYGLQAASATNQQLYFNSNVNISNDLQVDGNAVISGNIYTPYIEIQATTATGVSSSMTTGTGVYGYATGINGKGVYARTGQGRALFIERAGNNSSTNDLIEITDLTGGSADRTGNIIDITDNPTTSGTISGKILTATIGSTERIILNPRVQTGSTNEAYWFDTHNPLSGAKHTIFANQGDTLVTIDSVKTKIFNDLHVTGNIINSPPHIKSGYSDSAVVITGGTNVQVTNAGDSLFRVAECEGITCIFGDTVQTEKEGGYNVIYSIRGYGANGANWTTKLAYGNGVVAYEEFNVIQFTTTGANNRNGGSATAYVELEAGDKLWLVLTRGAGTGDLTTTTGTFNVQSYYLE